MLSLSSFVSDLSLADIMDFLVVLDRDTSNPNSPHCAATAIPPNTPAPRCPSIVLDRRGSTAGLSLNTGRGSLYSHTQGWPSISESPSESMRNSSHIGLRHVGDGASDDSGSSESVREDSHSNEETGLKPFRESFLLHPSLCYISLTVSSGQKMKRITTRVNYHRPPGLS